MRGFNKFAYSGIVGFLLIMNIGATASEDSPDPEKDSIAGTVFPLKKMLNRCYKYDLTFLVEKYSEEHCEEECGEYCEEDSKEYKNLCSRLRENPNLLDKTKMKIFYNELPFTAKKHIEWLNSQILPDRGHLRFVLWKYNPRSKGDRIYLGNPTLSIDDAFSQLNTLASSLPINCDGSLMTIKDLKKADVKTPFEYKIIHNSLKAKREMGSLHNADESKIITKPDKIFLDIFSFSRYLDANFSDNGSYWTLTPRSPRDPRTYY